MCRLARTCRYLRMLLSLSLDDASSPGLFALKRLSTRGGVLTHAVLLRLVSRAPHMELLSTTVDRWSKGLTCFVPLALRSLALACVSPPSEVLLGVRFLRNLESLHLTCSQSEPEPALNSALSFDFPRLRCLTLRRFHTSVELLVALLSGSPVLEALTFVYVALESHASSAATLFANLATLRSFTAKHLQFGRPYDPFLPLRPFDPVSLSGLPALTDLTLADADLLPQRASAMPRSLVRLDLRLHTQNWADAAMPDLQHVSVTAVVRPGTQGDQLGNAFDIFRGPWLYPKLETLAIAGIVDAKMALGSMERLANGAFPALKRLSVTPPTREAFTEKQYNNACALLRLNRPDLVFDVKPGLFAPERDSA